MRKRAFRSDMARRVDSGRSKPRSRLSPVLALVGIAALLPATAASAQQLILNPSAENSVPDDDGGTGDIADWVESPSTLPNGDTNDWLPFGNEGTTDGTEAFAVSSNGGEADSVFRLEQDIDGGNVSGGLEYAFSGDLMTLGADDARVLVEYRDGGGNVLEAYDTGIFNSAADGSVADGEYKTFTDTRTAPAGTELIKVVLLAIESDDETNFTDGFFDNLSLTVTGAPLTAENDGPYAAEVPDPLSLSAPGLLSNDALGSPQGTVIGFGGGDVGGTVTSNAPGASAAFAGGTLTVNADGSFSLSNPGETGTFTFQYRLGNGTTTDDATVTVEVAPNNLVVNPSAEEVTTEDDADGGSEDVADWVEDPAITASEELNDWLPFSGGGATDGVEAFTLDPENPADGSEFNLRQDVSSGVVTGGTQFDFSVDVKTIGTDEARVRLEYRDASGNVLDAYDSTFLTTGGAFTELNDSRVAPSGTATLRVRLLARESGGADDSSDYVDAFFDNVQLFAAGAPVNTADDGPFTVASGANLNRAAPGLVVNDSLGSPDATITAFGGGDLGGSVTANAAGDTASLAGGGLTVNADGSFALLGPTSLGTYTFDYRIDNGTDQSDGTVTIEVQAATGNNLIVNPGAENTVVDDDDAGNDPADWVESPDELSNGTTNNWVSLDDLSATEGANAFLTEPVNPPSGSEFKLQQDVTGSDVTPGLVYDFSGDMKSVGPDEVRIVVEYRDGGGVVLESFDSAYQQTNGSFTTVSDTRTAPTGTATIRVRLLAREGGGSTSYTEGAFDNLSLSVRNVAPAFQLNGPVSVTTPEDGAPLSVDADLAVDDPDPGQTLEWSLDTAPANGTVSGLPVTEGSGGTGLTPFGVTYEPDPDFAGSDSFTIRVFDGTDVDTLAFDVTVTPENDPPLVSLSPASASIAENNAPGVSVAQIVVDDDNHDGSVNSLSLSGADAGQFSVNGSQLLFTDSADFEAKQTYSVVVAVDDPNVGTAPDDTAGFTLNITNADDPPSFVATGPFSTNEADGNGTAVGDVDATDGDGGATDANLTYAIVGGNTDTAFAIDGGTGAITVNDASAVDFDANPTFTLDVEANDGTNAPTASVTVNVSNAAPSTPVDSDPVTGGSGEDGTVSEDAPNGTAVGVTGDAADPGGGDVSYALIDDAGGRFQINAGTGVVTVADTALIDFESATSHSITVRASDDDGADSGTASFTIEVTDVDSPPAFTANGPFTVAEAPANGTAVGDVDANDGDAGAADAGVIYVITGGNGGGAFAIDNTGVITVADGSLIDFETSASFNLAVEADDAGSTATALVTVNVTDEPPAQPADTDAGADSVAEDATNGTAVGVEVTSNDPAGGAVTYALTDDAGGRFAIDGAGVVTVADGGLIDFETSASHTVDIEARDADGTASDVLSVTIAITDAPDDPTVTAPPDLTGANAVDATGLYTRVDLERDGDASANDDDDGTLTPESDVDNPARLRPGTHEITWSATDSDGATVTSVQVVEVRPLVGIGPDRTVQEGTIIEVPVTLNGDRIDGTTPQIDFGVISAAGTADGSDHDLTDSTLTIVAGRTGAISVEIEATDEVGEGPETLVVGLTGTAGATVLSDRTRATITIVESNTPPVVSLSAEQGANDPAVVVDGASGAGPVTVTADTVDATSLGDMTFAWNAGATGLVDTDGVADDATFVFDPTQTTPGVYEIAVTATDDGAPAESATAALRLRVVNPVPTLAGNGDTDGDGTDDDEGSEGLSDRDGDGLPDYRDPFSQAGTIHERLGDGAGFLIETEPGLDVVLGPVAFARDLSGTLLTADDIADVLGQRDEVENVGGYFGFEIRGLPTPGAAVDVVIPQREPVPARAVYRKIGASGGWFDFVEAGGAAIASAPGAEGFCPPPGDSAYGAGLAEGDWCVQLTLVDGGANDADGAADGRILDPGGVARRAAPQDDDGGAGGDGTEAKASGSGGGGASGAAWLIGLVALWLTGRRPRGPRVGRRGCRCTVALLAALPLPWATVAAAPEEGAGTPAPGPWTIGATLMRVEGGEVPAVVRGGGAVGARGTDDQRTGWRVALGRRIDPHWTLEFGAVSLGDADAILDGPDADAVLQAADRLQPQTADGLSLGALGHWRPWAAPVTLSAGAGAWAWRSEWTVRAGARSRDYDRNGVDLYLTAAAGIELAADWQLRARWDRYHLDRGEADAFGVELLYRFD